MTSKWVSLASKSAVESADITMEPKVKLDQISKTFRNGVTANRNVTLAAEAGKIHAILGENGAGKSTLMNTLAGLYRPDSGEIRIDGDPVHFNNPFDAKKMGVGMVHQHFSLVPAFTVAENLALGSAKLPKLLKPKLWKRFLEEQSEKFGLKLRLDAHLAELSLGERQRVEIFRLLLEGAEILILDEPTSILSPNEAEILFEHLQNFANQGRTLLLVTHKIQHVRLLASQVTILRKGQVVASGDLSDFSDNDLTESMVGSHFDFTVKRSGNRGSLHLKDQEPLLDVKDLAVAPSRSHYGLAPSTFTLRKGEILGVAGISGNGQDELAEALAGLTKYEGTLLLNGTPVTPGSYKPGYIPDDRTGTGLALSMSLEENLAMRRYPFPPYSKKGIVQRDAFRERGAEMIQDFQIQPPEPTTPAANLSGGNMQKAVLARELDGAPPLIIASNPTAGLDIAAVKLVHETLLERADRGAGIVLISEDLDELLSLSDQIAVIRAGQIRGVFEVKKVDKLSIGFLMSADITGYLDDTDRLNGELAKKLNSYPCSDVLRKEVNETHMSALIELASNSTDEDVLGLAYTLLCELNQLPTVRTFFFAGWLNHTDFITRNSAIWRLLDYRDLDFELHMEFYDFVKTNWDAFISKQKNYFYGSKNVISGVQSRLKKHENRELSQEKAWAYLCASFASDDWPAVTELLQAYRDSPNPVVSNIVRDLLDRPELANTQNRKDEA